MNDSFSQQKQWRPKKKKNNFEASERKKGVNLEFYAQENIP